MADINTIAEMNAETTDKLHHEELKKIAAAYQPDDWATVMSQAPFEELLAELNHRAKVLIRATNTVYGRRITE